MIAARCTSRRPSATASIRTKHRVTATATSSCRRRLTSGSLCHLVHRPLQALPLLRVTECFNLLAESTGAEILTKLQQATSAINSRPFDHWRVKSPISEPVGDLRVKSSLPESVSNVETPFVGGVHVTHQGDQVTNRHTRWICRCNLQRVAEDDYLSSACTPSRPFRLQQLGRVVFLSQAFLARRQAVV